MNAFSKALEAPHNIEAEQALIGAILIKNDAYHLVSDFLKPEHFNEGLHSQIFETIGNQINANKVATFVTVKDFLPPDVKVGSLTLGQYMAMLVAEATTISNARNYGEAILACSVRRNIISLCEQYGGEAYQFPSGEAVSELVDNIIAGFMDLESQQADQTRDSQIATIVNQAIDSTAAAYQKRGVNGIGFPLNELNVINQGPMEAGSLYGLLGGTKEGKSSLTAQIMRQALSDGHPVLCLSYDQTGEQWTRQFAAQALGIDANRIRRGEISEKEFEEFTEYVTGLGTAPIEIIKCRMEGADRLCAYALRFLQKCRHMNKIPLVVADHVGKIAAYDKRADAGRQAGEVNQVLKSFAGEHKCVWFNLIQRNSDGGRRTNPRPMKRDVYGGEGAVADYDAIFYVYRAEKWLHDQQRSADPTKTKEIDRIAAELESARGKAEIGLIAHRFAPEHISREVKFIDRYTRYDSMPEDVPVFGEGF